MYKRSDEFNFIEKLLLLLAKYDGQDVVSWTEDLEFFVICNDVFWWGTADGENIETDNDILLLEKSFVDAGIAYGAWLYCARKRKMRPQGTIYRHIDEDLWHLFDECGPERKLDAGNPKKQGE